jgi:hypothetical protein
MKRTMMFATVVLVACGGGDSSGPSHPFPDVAGTYNMQGSFNGIPANVAFFNGTLTITQASLDAAALGGNSNITANLNGDIFNFANSLVNANVSTTGVVTFTIADASGQWNFTGTVANGAITGQHSLTDGTRTLSGTWNASKVSGTVRARAVPTNRLADLLSTIGRR